jgi:aspartate oxidase
MRKYIKNNHEVSETKPQTPLESVALFGTHGGNQNPVCAEVGSKLIIRSAQKRSESRGLHYTLDFPRKNAKAKPTVLDGFKTKSKQ